MIYTKGLIWSRFISISSHNYISYLHVWKYKQSQRHGSKFLFKISESPCILQWKKTWKLDATLKIWHQHHHWETSKFIQGLFIWSGHINNSQKSVLIISCLTLVIVQWGHRLSKSKSSRYSALFDSSSLIYFN